MLFPVCMLGAVAILRPRPTAFTWSGSALASHSNDANAYDVVGTGASIDTTTFGELISGAPALRTNGNTNSTIIYTSWGSGISTYTYLKVAVTTTTEDTYSSDLTNEALSYVNIYCSTDIGATWTNLAVINITSSGDMVNTTPQSYYVGSVDLSTFQVKIEATGTGIGTTINNNARAIAIADIYDVLLSTY